MESIKRSFIKKIDRIIEFEVIKDTNFCIYYDTFIDTINNKRKAHKKFGITSIENILNSKDFDEIDENIYVKRMFSNFASIICIKKLNLELIKQGNITICDCIEKISKYKFYSNEYEVFLWNGISKQLMNLKYEPISIPLTINTYDILDESYNLNEF